MHIRLLVVTLLLHLVSSHNLSVASLTSDEKSFTRGVTNITNLYDLYSPKLDGNSSYFTLVSDKVRITSSTELFFRFKSAIRNGILVSTIHHSSNRKFFIIVYILNSRLKAAFSCNGWEMLLIEHPTDIKVHNWYEIAFQLLFKRSHCLARLTVDKSVEIQAQQMLNITNSEWPCFSEFVFGKAASDWLELYMLITRDHFNGCLQDIHIDGFTRISEFNNVQECDHEKLLSCSLPVCGPNGECNSDGNSWKCSCPPGYYGRQCQRANCDPNPCSNGAICIQINRSQLTCLCNKGWYGNYCQLGMIC